MIKGGYYIKARCIKESFLASCAPCAREVWDYLLREANHKDRKYNGFVIKRGQLFRSYKQIRNDLSWNVGFTKRKYTVDQMKHCMKVLMKQPMIQLTKQPRGNLITVLNYAKYQDPKNYESTDESTDESTIDPPTVHQQPPSINKNVKNEKKIASKDTMSKAPVNYGNEEINKILEALKQKIGIDDFTDSQKWSRIYAKHCLNLLNKIGKDEFVRRLDFLLDDEFTAKNCNKIKFIYNNIKGFKEPPKNTSITI